MRISQNVDEIRESKLKFGSENVNKEEMGRKPTMPIIETLEFR